MKTSLSISALLILSYSCNNSAPKTENAVPIDTNSETIIDTVAFPMDSTTQILPPPTIQEYMAPRIDPIIVGTIDIVDTPTSMRNKIYQIADAGYNPYDIALGDAPDKGAESPICENPDERPEFKPANQLTKFLNDNLTYPDEALDMGITGIVQVVFIVERDGSISNIRIQKSSGHAQLDYEAKRVIRKMPRWSPGKMNGQAVRCLATLPIHFEISE